MGCFILIPPSWNPPKETKHGGGKNQTENVWCCLVRFEVVSSSWTLFHTADLFLSVWLGGARLSSKWQHEHSRDNLCSGGFKTHVVPTHWFQNFFIPHPVPLNLVFHACVASSFSFCCGVPLAPTYRTTILFWNLKACINISLGVLTCATMVPSLQSHQDAVV